MNVDINVLNVWKQNITGKGIVISVIDDGLDYRNPDLIDNFDVNASFDFTDMDNDPLPNPSLSESHGTRCAGEIAASSNNFCGIGVAFNSKIGGIRILDGPTNDLIESNALSFNRDYIDIYSNSWGPVDDGKTYGRPGPLTEKALKDGCLKGRKGLGNIFVWATGNGGLVNDDCNCDGYTTSIYTISIGSISDYGLSTYYSESCSSTLAVTINGASHKFRGENKIFTTDVNGKCVENFKGTSSAAPFAVGIIALMLEARYELTWRDIQHLIVISAQTTSELESDWQTNGARFKFNHKFGFGRMDAFKLVENAKKWPLVSKQKSCSTMDYFFNQTITENGSSSFSIDITSKSCDITKLEHVIVIVSFKALVRGHTSISLISPFNTRSILLQKRKNDLKQILFEWKLMSVHFWNENPIGQWRLIVNDLTSFNTTNYDTYNDMEDIEEAALNLHKNNTRLNKRNINSSMNRMFIKKTIYFIKSKMILYGT